MRLSLLAGLALAWPVLADTAPDPLTQPLQCERCAKWNEPVQPFRIHGNTFYVGVRGLSSLLIATSGGLILLDGDLPQSAPLIEANVRALGYRVREIRWILTSHGHSDHVGGIAALQRDSGAQVVASPSTAEALRLGHAVPDDPQFGYVAEGMVFPPLQAPVHLLHDGEVLKLGETAITAHFTPGHTPGSTSWNWQSCDAGHCLNLVYADSLNAISAPGFRYGAGRLARFRASIATVAALPCDILVTVHPDVSGLWDKLEARGKGVQPDPLIARDSCKAYAGEMGKLLDQRVAQEQAPKG
jgi:metallo-beta-lactamase class B